jgi:hypothetical protein
MSRSARNRPIEDGNITMEELSGRNAGVAQATRQAGGVVIVR